MNSGDKLIHNILRMEETKKFRRIKRTCIICGIVINNMTQHLQRKHSDLSDQEKIEYRAEMLRQTPIQRIGTAKKNVKKAIKCPLCLMPVQRIDNHLEKAHKLKRGTANMKSLVAQAKDSGAVTATEPNSRGSEEILFDVIEIETSQEEQEGQMTEEEQPNSRATKEAVFDVVKIEADDENQDSQMDQTKETPGKTTGGMDNAGDKNQGSRKKHRIKRTCIICGEIINHMALHLRKKHPDLSDQEKTEYRAEMLRQTPIRKVHVGSARKILSSLDCPLCGLPVQRLDGHLVNAHKLERGTAKVTSLVYQAKVGARKKYKIKRTCIICGEIISRMALHLERKHPDLSDTAKMEYRAEMLRRRPIHKRGAPRKNWKSCFECPLCRLPVQRIDGHLVNAHKLKRGTAKMKSLVSQAKDRGPVTAEDQAKSSDTQKNICDKVDKGVKKSQRRIKRTCIICGEVTDEMTRHLENKHPDLSIQEKMEYRAEMRRRTPIRKRGTTRENMRRTFDCPLCQFPVQRIGVHLIDMHKLIKGTAKLKSLVSQAKDGGAVTAEEEAKSRDTRENISDQVDKDRGPVKAAQQPKSRDTQENMSDQVEKDTVEGKQDDQMLMDQTKEFSESMRESTGGMDKAGEENQEKKLSSGKPPDSHTSLLLNTSTDKDGAKKFHRIKRTCIICGVVINNMTQHLQRKHRGLSNQEKIEYKAEMLRQTPIHQRRRTRENIKRTFECPLCGLPVQRIDEHLIKQHKLIRGTAKLKSLVCQAKEACRSASRTSKKSDDESRHVSSGEITEDDLHANPGLHATSHAVLEENSAILNNHSPGRQSRQKRMARFPPTEKLQHLCFVCGKLFNSKSNLANHMTVHSGKRSHHCSVCDKLFTSRYSLVNHARIHSGEKPYRCDECDGKFSTRSRLASHKMYHTGKKPHRCLLCDKAFSKQQDLKGHMEVHTGLKKFECVLCDKAFAKEGFLKVHMRIHADNKSYQCSICKKAFTTKRYLEGHMVIHSG